VKEDLDRPTIQRRRAAKRAKSAGGNAAEDMDYLDIPAFLRRQAD
jgi:cell division protein FtsZ